MPTSTLRNDEGVTRLMVVAQGGHQEVERVTRLMVAQGDSPLRGRRVVP